LTEVCYNPPNTMALSESRLIHGPRFTHDRTGDVRALLTDVDKTLLPNESLGNPTERVTQALRAASEIVPTGLATARQPQKAKYLIEHLGLSGLSILSNGAQIYNGETGVIVIERSLPQDTTMTLALELQNRNITHWVQDDGVDHRWNAGSTVARRSRMTTEGLGSYLRPVDIRDKSAGQEQVNNYKPTKPFVLVAHDITAEQVIDIEEMVRAYDDQGFTAFVAHEHDKPDGIKTFEVFITHKKTNKRDAMNEVAEMQRVPLEDTMAMGDGPNDTVLVVNAGIGVAVENAVDATKKAAVYIAPSQENDGAADAIEELILIPHRKAA